MTIFFISTANEEKYLVEYDNFTLSRTTRDHRTCREYFRARKSDERPIQAIRENSIPFFSKYFSALDWRWKRKFQIQSNSLPSIPKTPLIFKLFTVQSYYKMVMSRLVVFIIKSWKIQNDFSDLGIYLWFSGEKNKKPRSPGPLNFDFH